jgi:hypothetical protein
MLAAGTAVPELVTKEVGTVRGGGLDIEALKI